MDTPRTRGVARPANPGPAAAPENRRRLIAAARAVFVERGLDAPLSAIARRAGVGQGSLYRHFPDRVALAIAVFDDNIVELEALASAPTTTALDLLDAVAAQATDSAGVVDLVASARDDARAQHLADRISLVARTVIERGHARGWIRSDVDATDLLVAISMLALAISRSAPASRGAVVERALALLAPRFSASGPSAP